MEENKVVYITNSLSKVYDDIDEIYESLVDGEYKESEVVIDNAIKKLKALKSDISIKTS